MAEKTQPQTGTQARKSKFDKQFKFLEKQVVADVAFEAYGKNPDELFSNAALATMEIMVNTAAVEPKLKKIIKLQSKDMKNLLIDFLNEIIYYKDAEQIFLSKFDVKIKQKDDGVWLLTAEISGEPLNYKKHQLRADVKAATHNLLELKQEGKKWTAKVVLDI